jgi:hypothetical protein
LAEPELLEHLAPGVPASKVAVNLIIKKGDTLPLPIRETGGPLGTRDVEGITPQSVGQRVGWIRSAIVSRKM